MDDALRQQIRQLAEENGLDPEELERVFVVGDVPEELMSAISGVLGDVSVFSEALGKLKDED